MLRSPILLAYCLALLLQPVGAEAPPRVRLCSGDAEVYPWTLFDKEGLSQFLLRRVGERLGSSVQITPLPWKRCLAEARAGLYDGVSAMSYTAERGQQFVFPLRAAEQPDASRRISSDTYSLYRLRNSTLSGTGFSVLNGVKVAAQAGYSIVQPLKEAGAIVDDSQKEADEALRKVSLGMVTAAALLSREGDSSLQSGPYRDSLQRVDPPLLSKDYFTVFHADFVHRHAAFSQRFWQECEAVRTSAEYRSKLREFGVVSGQP